MQNEQFTKRRKYLIANKFQLKYTFIIVAFMFLIAWLSGFTVYYTAFGFLGEKLANVYPQGRLAVIFKNVNLILLVRIGLLIPLVVITSILVSHRIAGPIFKMERHLAEVATGDFSSELKLRKRDEFKALADVINKMTGNLADIVRENGRVVREISSITNDLKEELGQQKPDRAKTTALLERLAASASDLQERYSGYRV